MNQLEKPLMPILADTAYGEVGMHDYGSRGYALPQATIIRWQPGLKASVCFRLSMRWMAIECL